MGKRKASSRLKSNTSAKAWGMLLEGRTCLDIGKELGYRASAIRAYAKRKWCDHSMTAWADEIKKVGVCEIPGCGISEHLNAHHLLEKTVWTQFSRDLTNGICLCTDHHTFNINLSPHTNLPAVQEFLRFIEIERPGVWVWYNEHKCDVKYQGCDYEAAYRELSK